MSGYYPQPQMPVWTMPNGDRWHLYYELLADAMWLCKEMPDGALSLEISFTVGTAYINDRGGVEAYAPVVLEALNAHLAKVYGEGSGPGPGDPGFPQMDEVTAALVMLMKSRFVVDGYRLKLVTSYNYE